MSKPAKGRPSASEFGRLRAHLARLGWSQAQVREAIGSAVAGRSRAEIVQAIINYLRSKNGR